MENAEEIYHFLEDFSKRKTKTIPQELNEYLAYVARTGDPVYQWSLIKCLFKEKLLNVITDFYEATPSVEIPLYPNVDPFNYDIMKNSLIERLETFTAAPFTVQRICELLTFPRKQYNRVDKYMRAIEKNILVVSTREPGNQRHAEIENGEPLEPMVNGSDNNSDYSVDVEMEEMSWKENNVEPQPEAKASSSEIQAPVEPEQQIEKEEMTIDTAEKVSIQYESVTPPEENIEPDEPDVKLQVDPIATDEQQESVAETSEELKQPKETPEEPKVDVEMKVEEEKEPISIPEIKVDDAEMTEQRLLAEANTEKAVVDNEVSEKVTVSQPFEPEPEPEPDTENEITQVTSDESDSNKEESKITPEVSSSEESSSSDNTDASSNSPKTDAETSSDPQDIIEPEVIQEEQKEELKEPEPVVEELKEASKMQSEEYSIADVKSEVPASPEVEKVEPPEPVVETKVEAPVIEEKEEVKDTPEVSDESKESAMV